MPVTVGLVIDNSTSMLTERELVVAGTNSFAQSSHPEDEMFAIVFNEHVRRGLPDTIQFTTNRLQLQASLQRYQPGGKTAFYDAVIFSQRMSLISEAVRSLKSSEAVSMPKTRLTSRFSASRSHCSKSALGGA